MMAKILSYNKHEPKRPRIEISRSIGRPIEHSDSNSKAMQAREHLSPNAAPWSWRGAEAWGPPGHRHARRGALGVGGRRHGGPEWSRGGHRGGESGEGSPPFSCYLKMAWCPNWWDWRQRAGRDERQASKEKGKASRTCAVCLLQLPAKIRF